MKRKLIFRLILSAILLIPPAIHAQVTVGSDIPTTRGALLEIKTQQANAANATTDTGGLLLPRVALVSTNTLQPFVDITDAEWTNATRKAALIKNLTGLMVYNVANVGTSLYPGLYTWDGLQWSTSQANPSAGMEISQEPKAFTFYETGLETSVQPLEFVITGASGTVTYQWYQVTGNNVHVRIGTAIGGSGTISGSGATTAAFTPSGVLKGTTRNAGNTGIYRFYCEATDGYGKKLQSATAEVAVGCGAKNNAGEWISFMCFNLGAQNNITIAEQKAYNVGSYTNNANGVTNQHAYIAGEENVWGSLFQWGRIADGHELRSFTGAGGTPTNTLAYGAMATSDIGGGYRCSSTDTQRPWNQVLKGTAWYGNFVITVSSNNNNWSPLPQSTADQLWRTSRFVQNDPCAHYKTDGSYQEFWHEGTQDTSDSDACTDAGTAWRMPSQDEWGNLYKGGVISGTPGAATANTWVWHGGTSTPITTSRGFEIKPDGETTTLFLPASGYRNTANGLLYNQGAGGYYWSSSVISTNAYNQGFSSGSTNPANIYNRGYGFALRCVKNQ